MYYNVSDLFAPFDGAAGDGRAATPADPSAPSAGDVADTPATELDGVEELLSEPSPYRQPTSTSTISGLSADDADALINQLFEAAE